MGNLIQTIETSVKRGFDWLKDRMQAISNIIQGWYNRYKEHRAGLKRHREYLDCVLDCATEYTPEEVDIELSDRLRHTLQSIEDGKLLEYLKSLPFEQRKEYIEKFLLPLVCKEMSVSPKFLDWFQNESTIGYYCEKYRGIALNELYLASDNDYILRVFINTIIHECKHARQWDAVAGRNTHGYSDELILKWRINFQDYIAPEESDEGYVKQPVEWDASSFAENVYSTDN